MAGFLIVANFMFCFFVTDQPAEFTKLTKDTAKVASMSKKSNSKTALTSVKL
jgi:hypothetical protein